MLIYRYCWYKDPVVWAVAGILIMIIIDCLTH